MLVGERLFSINGIVARAANALAVSGINIAAISMSGGFSLTLGVDNADLVKAIKALYHEFFNRE